MRKRLRLSIVRIFSSNRFSCFASSSMYGSVSVSGDGSAVPADSILSCRSVCNWPNCASEIIDCCILSESGVSSSPGPEHIFASWMIACSGSSAISEVSSKNVSSPASSVSSACSGSGMNDSVFPGFCFSVMLIFSSNLFPGDSFSSNLFPPNSLSSTLFP